MAALTLQQQLDIVMRKNREYEETILHLSTHSRRHPIRTQHGFICPDCSFEVAHACHSVDPPRFSITSSDNNQPQMNRSAAAMRERQSRGVKERNPRGSVKGRNSRGNEKHRRDGGNNWRLSVPDRPQTRSAVQASNPTTLAYSSLSETFKELRLETPAANPRQSFQHDPELATLKQQPSQHKYLSPYDRKKEQGSAARQTKQGDDIAMRNERRTPKRNRNWKVRPGFEGRSWNDQMSWW